PPAYADVWICPLPNGHLQATGRDARGRVQYRYHPLWRQAQDAVKFERMEAFGRALPRIRARVQRDLAPASTRRPATLPRTLVLATLVRLLDATRLRVGNESYAQDNGSFGLSTLRNRHVQVRGQTLRLRFRGKGGVMHESELDDPRVARVVQQCQELPGQELFQYMDEQGELHRVSAGDVNSYLKEASGGDFTAKDFRTWHGTVLALELTRAACEELSRDEAAPAQSKAKLKATAKKTGAAAIVAAVALKLGNTPAVCKKAYVHPAVLALGQQLTDDSATLVRLWPQLATTRRPRGLAVAETRLLQFMRRLRLSLRREQSAPAPARKTPQRGRKSSVSASGASATV
ncbi:MAG: DNA topoisomerase IB, partial [Comamonadaceae bacterium]